MARTLNILLRNDLATQLAVLAVKRHGAALGRLAKHLKKDHRKIYEAKLLALEPDISLAKWADLIQKRLVSGKSSSDAQYYYYLKPSSKEGEEPTRTTTTLYSASITTIASAKSGEQRHARYESFISALKQQPGFGAVLSMFDSYTLTRRSPSLKLKGPDQPDLPHVDGAGYLDTAAPAEDNLVKDYQAVIARLYRILVEGWSYLEQCHELLEACKTDKQLEDLFPEAAKLLPPEIKSSGNMVPVELAAKVRKMLETGVPAE